MSAHVFGTFIEVEAPSNRSPIPIAKNYHNAPDNHDLDSLEWGARLNGPRAEQNTVLGSNIGYQTPETPNDLEMSRLPSPRNIAQDEVDALQSFSNPPMNRFRMASVCFMNFSNGLSDSAPGALLPYIEKHYDIGYAMVSLIFVTNAAGFIMAAFVLDALRSRIGRAKTLVIGQSLLIIAYIAILCTPPFGVVVASFLLLGMGMAMNLALGNVFAANLHNSTTMLGAMHGSYGLGGTVGPIIATAMVTKGNLIWTSYYSLNLSISIFNLGFAAWSFWQYEAESNQSLLTRQEDDRINAPNTTQEPTLRNNVFDMVKAFKLKAVIIGAFFIFAYQGAEVSISGWVISFLIASRHGNPSAVGYVTAGFWGGITIGRFLLSHPAHKIGEKLFVYGMIIGSAVFELLVWQVPNVIGDSVALSLVGLLLGPIYPCAMVVFSRQIGRKEQVSSLGVISAFGSSGGALAPFTTGILAQSAGTFVLHPIAIGLFGSMLVCWFYLPNVRKRTD